MAPSSSAACPAAVFLPGSSRVRTAFRPTSGTVSHDPGLKACLRLGVGLGIQRPSATSVQNQEEKAAEYSNVRSRIADHVPESLVWMEKLRDLGGSNRGRDDDEQGDGRSTRPETKKHKTSAYDFEAADEMGD